MDLVEKELKKQVIMLHLFKDVQEKMNIKMA